MASRSKRKARTRKWKSQQDRAFKEATKFLMDKVIEISKKYPEGGI